MAFIKIIPKKSRVNQLVVGITFKQP